MVGASILIDDKGREIRPEKWKGSSPGGRHRAGELLFETLAKDVQSIKLVIKGGGGAPERVFEWKIER